MKKTLLVLLLAAIPFFPLLAADFVNWDDPHNLSANPDMLHPTPTTIASYWNRPYKDLYVPITYTLWSAVAALATDGTQLNPTTFHLLNILLHLGSAAAVYLLLNRLTAKPWPALLGALIFALHPLQVESVGWISGMKDVLAGMLALWSIYLLILTLDTHRWPLYLLATLLFALAMLSKPSAIVTPLLALIICASFRRNQLRRSAMLILPWFLLCIPILFIARRAQATANLDFVPSIAARPLIAADALAFYVRQLLFPLRLAIDYGRSPQWLLQSPQRYFTWILPAALLVIALLVRRKFPSLLASFLLFAAALLPTLGLTPFDFQSYSTVADHYAYLALLGPALLVAFLLAQAPPKAALKVGFTVVVLLGLRSLLQAFTWTDSTTLFSHALEINPDSLAANVNLGRLHADAADSALATARKFTGQAQLIAVQAAQRESDQAIFLFRAALAHHPRDFIAWKNLGNMLKLQARWSQSQQAYENALDHAAGVDPSQQSEIHASLATMLANQKKYNQAIAEFQRALALDPSNAAARSLLQQVRAAAGQH